MPRSTSFTIAAVLCLALATSAQAQIPNPLRRAKAKVAQAVTGQPAQATQGALKFDDVMLELNAPVLDRVVLGLRARANHKGSNGRSASELRRRADELNKEAETLNMDRSNDRFEFNNKLGNAQNCVGEVLRGISQKQNQDMQRRFMGMTGANLQGDQSANAKFMQEYQRLSMEIGAAAAAADTARARKAQAAWNKLMGIDPKADTAKANAQCNVPPPPAWMARADAASDESNRLYNEAREVEAAGNVEGTTASGMTAEQFAMALERIQTFVIVEGTRGFGKFSQAELAALDARLAELRVLVS